MKKYGFSRLRQGISLVLVLILFGLSVLPGTAAQAVRPELPFADVTEEDWFFEAVSTLYFRKILFGVSEKEFAPGEPLSRGMLATMLYRLEDKPEVSGSCRFSDVSADAYYSDAVIWASENRIVSGVGGDCFAPQTPVSRQQIAVMLRGYARFRGLDIGADGEILEQFADAGEISGYAVSAMAWAVENSLIRGIEENLLAPQAEASRAEAAAIVYRLVK